MAGPFGGPIAAPGGCACCGTTTPSCPVSFNFTLCGASATSGSVTVSQGGSTVATATLSGSGLASLSLPSGTYDVDATGPNGSTFHGTFTMPSPCTAQSRTFALSPPTGFVCCGAKMAPATLHFVDSNGTWTMPFRTGIGWEICCSTPARSVTVKDGTPCVCTQTNASVPYYVRVRCSGQIEMQYIVTPTCDNPAPHINYPTVGVCPPPGSGNTMAATGTGCWAVGDAIMRDLFAPGIVPVGPTIDYTFNAFTSGGTAVPDQNEVSTGPYKLIS